MVCVASHDMSDGICGICVFLVGLTTSVLASSIDVLVSPVKMRFFFKTSTAGAPQYAVL